MTSNDSMVKKVSECAIDSMMSHSWTNNKRIYQNVYLLKEKICSYLIWQESKKKTQMKEN